MSDHALLTAYARRGDAQAFAQLVRGYQDLVYGTAMRRLRHADDAREATQQTFIKLARAAGTIQGTSPGELGAWLHRTTVNTCRDLVRAAGRRRTHESAYAQARPTADWPGDVSWGEVSAALDEAIAELDDERRGLVVEHFLAGRSQRELAGATGLSPATVSRRLASAVEALREALGRRGVVTPTAGVLGTAMAGALPAAAGTTC
ncbi:MAG: sigma-70 family RNA polymerase sigma factor [Planctomycetota bacterium]